MPLGRYQKTIAALVTGLIGWGAVVVASAATHVTASEWLALAVVLATPLGVYAVPNSPEPAPVPTVGEIPVTPAIPAPSWSPHDTAGDAATIGRRDG